MVILCISLLHLGTWGTHLSKVTVVDDGKVQKFVRNHSSAEKAVALN